MNEHVDVKSLIAGMQEAPPLPPPSAKHENEEHQHRAGVATTKSTFHMTYTQIRNKEHEEKFELISSIVLEWIEATLPKLSSLENQDLRKTLENGAILCHLMRKIKHGSIKKYHKHAKIGTYFADDNVAMFLHACKEHLHLPSDFMFNATYLHSGASIEELNFVCTCLVEVCCRAYLYFGIPPTERMRHLKDFYTVKKSVVKDLKKRRKRGDVKSKDLEQIMERARTVVQHDEDNVDMAVSSSEKRASRGKQLLDEFIRKRMWLVFECVLSNDFLAV